MEISKHLQEGIDILSMLGEDTSSILAPLRDADSIISKKEEIKENVKKNKSVWEYLTPEEQEQYILTYKNK